MTEPIHLRRAALCRLCRYKQVFTDNMSTKGKPKITACKASDNWTRVEFKPDLGKFGMAALEDDTVSLMAKRVYDLAGVLGKGVKVATRPPSHSQPRLMPYREGGPACSLTCPLPLLWSTRRCSVLLCFHPPAPPGPIDRFPPHAYPPTLWLAPS